MSWLTMLKNMFRAFSAAWARSSASSSSAACFADCSSWITNTWKKQFTMRHPSDVKGVSGHTTCRTMATDMVTPHRTTIALRRRENPLVLTPFATTSMDTSMPKAIIKKNAGSRSHPVW